MNHIMQWLDMGKYSVYVWPAYGIVAIVLLMQVLGIKWQRKKTMNKLKMWFKK